MTISEGALDPSKLKAGIARRVAELRSRVESAFRRAGRSGSMPQILPIVKNVGADELRAILACGFKELGEGTVQGALFKRSQLDDSVTFAWHLVGRLQRNKARKAVRVFHAMHSLDSERLAESIEEQLAAGEPLLDRIFVEVNIAGESTKGGFSVASVAGFLRGLEACPLVRARLAGLMAMAPHNDDPEAARPCFRRLRELRDELVSSRLLPAKAGLSMGMSGDFEVAVEEGATLVRIGSRLFEEPPA